MRISDWSSDVCSSDLFAHSSLRRCLMAPTAAHPSTSPIIVSGQLTLRTIRGRNGPFTVGRLTTHLGVFEVKDAELEQYPEGKYDGEFVIRYIYPRAYPTGGGKIGRASCRERVCQYG